MLTLLSPRLDLTPLEHRRSITSHNVYARHSLYHLEYGLMALENAYRHALPASQALFERAQHLFPDGVTHDNRRMQPFPVFIERADGAYKCDVDGRQYIDYWMGHGALIMGHNPPHVRDAVIEQATRGTHYGASHPLEVAWAEWVCKLVPCAERVRFTASGTESTHMALRLARAYTGKQRVIKFAGHFHGWHEGLEVGVQTPYETAPEPGQLPESVAAVVLCPPNDIAAVRAALAAGDDGESGLASLVAGSEPVAEQIAEPVVTPSTAVADEPSTVTDTALIVALG